jgi:hypothetical protein
MLLRHLVAMTVFTLSVTASAATTQHWATVRHDGDAFVCHSLLVEVPSHEVLADQTVRVKAGLEGQAVSGTQTATGIEFERRMTCRVNERGDRALVFVKSSRSEKGVGTLLSTHQAQVAVTPQRAN